MYEVRIYSFGKIIGSMTFNNKKDSNYKKVRSFYDSYNHNWDEYAPFLYKNGVRQKIPEADKYFKLV